MIFSATEIAENQFQIASRDFPFAVDENFENKLNNFRRICPHIRLLKLHSISLEFTYPEVCGFLRNYYKKVTKIRGGGINEPHYEPIIQGKVVLKIELHN